MTDKEILQDGVNRALNNVNCFYKELIDSNTNEHDFLRALTNFIDQLDEMRHFQRRLKELE